MLLFLERQVFLTPQWGKDEGTLTFLYINIGLSIFCLGGGGGQIFEFRYFFFKNEIYIFMKMFCSKNNHKLLHFGQTYKRNIHYSNMHVMRVTCKSSGLSIFSKE